MDVECPVTKDSSNSGAACYSLVQGDTSSGPTALATDRQCAFGFMEILTMMNGSSVNPTTVERYSHWIFWHTSRTFGLLAEWAACRTARSQEAYFSFRFMQDLRDLEAACFFAMLCRSFSYHLRLMCGMSQKKVEIWAIYHGSPPPSPDSLFPSKTKSEQA